MHRDKRIARAVLQGYSNAAIARQHGLSRQRVVQIRQDMGLPAARVMPATRERYRRNPVLVERDDTIIRMYQDDAPIAQIMRDLGVTRAVVGNVISKAGVAQDRHMRRNARNQRIVDRYLEGVPLKELATEFGITIKLVGIVIHDAGVANRRPLQDQDARRAPKFTERNQRIATRYQEGVAPKDLAGEFGITRWQVYRVIHAAGDAVCRPVCRHKDPKIAARNQQIVARYQEGVPSKDLAAEFGVGIHLVYAAIRAAGVVQGRQKQEALKIAARNQRIVARYQEGVPYQDLAMEFGISFSLVNYVIRTAGVANRNRRVHHRTGATP